MYNIAISTVAGLAVFALASVWLGPIAGIIPALIVMIGVMYGLSRRTAAQVEAEMQRIVPLLQNRQIPEALALLDDVKGRYGPWQLLLEGQIDSQIGMIDYLQLKFDDALPKLEKGKWRNWSALTCIGCIHWRKGAKEAAYKELSDAASVAGKESIVYLVWATLLTRDGERQRALEVLDQGLKEMPDSEHLKNLHKVVANKKKINTKVFPQTWYQFFPEEMAQQMMMRGRRDGPPPGMPEAPNQRISARRAPRR
ncbi:MAG: tetratricopeptide repeat protein [Alphaproteobacteria bacterium]|nr:tetratricopeptide repeat protein [Alphaproteobacteria bacterium]